MIERKDILSIPFLKKSPFTGSYQGMRYRLEKLDREEEVLLQAVIWPGPYSFLSTLEEKKEYQTFAFSEEGICQAVDWLNMTWNKQPEYWKKAQSEW